MTGEDLRKRRQELRLSQAKFSELTGLSQHLLSAFELGKGELSASELQKVQSELGNSAGITALVERKKRYRAHHYHLPYRTDASRASLCRLTQRNEEYTKLLRSLESQRGMEPNGLNALSLFSGCGGFSLGFSWAGFKIKGFVELDAGLRRIYKKNFSSTVECGSDITKIDDNDLENIAQRLGKVDVIIGGPPCQGFSLSGKRDIRDPRNSLFRHYLRFVSKFKPQMAFMENVRLLTSMKNEAGGLVRDEIVKEFSLLGYDVNFFEVNAKHYGVPQHRERVIFVAVRSMSGLAPSVPRPVFGGADDLFGSSSACRTFADACSDLDYLESGERSTSDPCHVAVNHPAHVIEWLWNVREGKSAHDNEEPELRPPSGYNTTYKRQIWNEPAATVQTTFGMISGCRNVHPIATRSLTVREAARLQSFPDTFHFVGPSGTIRTGIGNAVPPLLAFEMGKHAANLLLKSCKSSLPLS